MRRLVLVLVALAIAAAVAYRLAAPGAGAGRKKAGDAAASVRLARATRGDVPRRIELTGRTEADASVLLKSRVDGQVFAVPFAEGQHVRQGEVLVQLDPADLQAKLEQAAANLSKSRAEAARARADVERYIALRQKGFVSDEKVGEMRTAAAAAAATEKADAAALELARLQRAYTAIRAPFAGLVGAQLVYAGSAVKANDTGLVTINRVKPLKVSFAVPEKYLPQLHAALRAGRGTMQAAIATPDGQPVAGEVRFLDNSVDTASGTIQLKAILPNADEALTPGQFVAVGLVLETLRDAVTIPAEAVQQGSEGSFVYVARDGKAAVRHVRIAAVQDGIAVVAEGLAAGEDVVTEGQLRLTDGAPFRDVGATSTKTTPQPN